MTDDINVDIIVKKKDTNSPDIIIFKKINNNENLNGLYVSDNGDILNYETNLFYKLSINNGYKTFHYQGHNFAVNRLVASAFIPTNDYSLVVDHIDGDKLNNNKNNLQWLTQKENIAKVNVETSHARKVIQKDLDGKVIKIFDTITIAAKEIGCDRALINRSCHNDSNKKKTTAKGFIFDYVDEEKYKRVEVDLTDAKLITDYKHYYVFKDGTIYNNQRKTFLKPVIDKNKHAYVTLPYLKNDAKEKTKRGDNVYINQIVANAFLPNPDPTKYKHVEHINIGEDKEGKNDNRVENLKWVY